MRYFENIEVFDNKTLQFFYSLQFCIVKKTPIKVCYKSQRNASTDFPVLTCCASYMNDTYSVVIGGSSRR